MRDLGETCSGKIKRIHIVTLFLPPNRINANYNANSRSNVNLPAALETPSASYEETKAKRHLHYAAMLRDGATVGRTNIKHMITQNFILKIILGNPR